MAMTADMNRGVRQQALMYPMCSSQITIVEETILGLLRIDSWRLMSGGDVARLVES